MPEIITIPQATVTIGDVSVDTLITEVQRLVAEVPAVLDDTTAPDCQALLSDIVKLKGLIDKQRVAAKAPYLEAGKVIDATAKRYIGPIVDFDVVLRGRLQEYQWSVERARQAALAEQAALEAKARAEAKPGQTPALGASASVAIPVAVGVKTRATRELVFDLGAIPREYMMPDVDKIEADLALGKIVPGVKVVMVNKVVAR